MPSSKFVYLTGKVYGDLIVVSKVGKNTYGNTVWLCKCSCGKEVKVCGSDLNSGNSKSCGHPITHCKRGHEFTPENTLVRARKSGKTQRTCRTCKRLQEKKDAPKNRIKKNAAKRAWLKKNPESAAKSHKKLWAMVAYGLTLEEYEQKLKLQSNVCALCKEEFEGTRAQDFAPVLDHDHNDGALREFIHSRCNKAIGQFGDDIELLRLAIEYLERHQELKKCTNQKENPGVSSEARSEACVLTPIRQEINPGATMKMSQQNPKKKALVQLM